MAELIIGDHNWTAHTQPPQGGAMGLVPRNYSASPVGAIPHTPVFAFPVSPQGEWAQRLADQIAAGRRNSDFRRRGNNGGPIPSLDQNGKGYCTPPGTKISMADGTFKKIEDVQLHDEVLSAEGNARRVIDVYVRQHQGEMCVVDVWGNGHLRVTPNHEVLTDRGYVPSGDLTPDDWVAIPSRKESLRKRVLKVERHPYSDVVYNFAVEVDNSYVADGVGVHNCWAHSTTQAVQVQRAIRGLPYVGLSAYAVACKIKGFRDEGGWNGESLAFLVETGVPTEKFWPQRSMDRSNDNAATWENAALHKVSEGFYDLAAPIWGQKLSFDQLVTALLLNMPAAIDEDWWGHSICALDPVNGATQRGITRAESGKLLDLAEFDLTWGMNNAVTGGTGIRILNSWGDTYGDMGEAVLTGSKCIPDSATAVAVAGGSVS